MTGRTITALRFQKRDKERVNLFLDGEYAFPLPAVEAAQLRIGQQLSEQEIEELRAIDLRSRGYNRALRFLAVRPRSQLEVRRNLKAYRPKDGRRLGALQIEWIIAGLRERQYLDDREFARFWVEQRNRFRPIAPRALRYELRQKGVDDSVAQAAIDELSDATSACEAAARSRMYRWQEETNPAHFRSKVGSFLQRRGFDWEVAREVIDRIWQELEEARVSSSAVQEERWEV
ncbi:MAG: RecX family transcriptional regulator [Caldilineaceae bacterium]|nr:RecX family transcriptional regulator [Caldilineaceae bacterium]